MTWNVENLFPVGWSISPQHRVTQAEFDAKLAFLATQITAIRPDILAMQELGGEDADVQHTLETLNTQLGLRYQHRIARFADGRKIRVAFLVANELTLLDDQTPQEIVTFADGELHQVADWHDSVSTHLGRGALPITVRVGTRTIRLIALHLKSKLVSYVPHPHQSQRFAPDNENERAIGAGLALLRRTAEAVTIRIRLNDAMQADASIDTIVLGDFNDEPHAATSLTFLGPEDQDASRPDSFDGVRLYNLVTAIPLAGAKELRLLPPIDAEHPDRSENYTRSYKGRPELIDHILVSRSLLGSSDELKQGRSLVKEVRLRVDLIKGQQVSDTPTDRLGKAASDHAPVYARFALP
jgi:endonuclease/exonuclease/phosphatase family metal-dependent hydrolase